MTDKASKKLLKHQKYLAKQTKEIKKAVKTEKKASEFKSSGFEPSEIEKGWSDFWNKNCFFQPEFNERIRCFCDIRFDYSDVEQKIKPEILEENNFRQKTIESLIKTQNSITEDPVDASDDVCENMNNGKKYFDETLDEINQKIRENEGSVITECTNCRDQRVLRSKPFVITLPPPNITGKLHIGHALMLSIEDAFIRYHRLKGHPTLFLPGTDHAGIATQTIVEKKIAKYTSRVELGRDRFNMEVEKWRNEHGSLIYEQMLRMGASLDLTRKRFTLDKEYSKLVTQAFCVLFGRNLIHRDSKIVSYCAKLKTTLSDLEVISKEIQPFEKIHVDGKDYVFGVMHFFKYPIVKGSASLMKHTKRSENKILSIFDLDTDFHDEFYKRFCGSEVTKNIDNVEYSTLNLGNALNRDSFALSDLPYLTVGTTRIETILGDTAICLNPLDTRRNILENCFAINPLNLNILPIIYDDHCDMTFGSGCLKVTPAHDFNDFEIGKRHGLEHIEILDNSNRIQITIPQRKNLDQQASNISPNDVSSFSNTNSPQESFKDEITGKYPFYQKSIKFLKKIQNSTRFDARHEIVAFLKEQNLFVEEKGHAQVLPICSRSNDIIEPRIKKQWFMKCKGLAQKVLGLNMEIVPEEAHKLWKNWLNNIQEWCLSRQLWYGHRIPAFRVFLKVSSNINELNHNSSTASMDTNSADRENSTNEHTICNNQLGESNEPPMEISFSSSILKPMLDSQGRTLWVVGSSNFQVIQKLVQQIHGQSVSEFLLAEQGIDVEALSSEITFTFKSKIYVFQQDEDVLDTWFSSGLWPFATLNYQVTPQDLREEATIQTGAILGPDSSEGPKSAKNNSDIKDNSLTTQEHLDFQKYFPNTILETGYDILFFWVARMCILSLELTKRPPFKTILLHGIVRDAHGLKMSKSLGNVIDPLFIINGITLKEMNDQLEESFKGGFISEKEYKRGRDAQSKDFPHGISKLGSDALRFAMCAYYNGMKDINLDIKRVEGYRKLCNKIYNAHKFISKVLGIEIFSNDTKIPVAHLCWILKKHKECIGSFEKGFANFNTMQATSSIYSFFLYEFCDIFIEIMKKITRKYDLSIMKTIFIDILKMFSVFMPFISEEIYQKLRSKSDPPSISVAGFPKNLEFEIQKLKINPFNSNPQENSEKIKEQLRDENNSKNHENKIIVHLNESYGGDNHFSSSKEGSSKSSLHSMKNGRVAALVQKYSQNQVECPSMLETNGLSRKIQNLSIFQENKVMDLKNNFQTSDLNQNIHLDEIDSQAAKFEFIINVVKSTRSLCETKKIQKFTLITEKEDTDLSFYGDLLLKNCEKIEIQNISPDVDSFVLNSTKFAIIPCENYLILPKSL